MKLPADQMKAAETLGLCSRSFLHVCNLLFNECLAGPRGCGLCVSYARAVCCLSTDANGSGVTKGKEPGHFLFRARVAKQCDAPNTKEAQS